MTLDRVLDETRAHPRAAARADNVGVTREIRQRSVGRFIYLVVYEIIAGEIDVIAIAHKHQLPGYWKRRGRRRGP